MSDDKDLQKSLDKKRRQYKACRRELMLSIAYSEIQEQEIMFLRRKLVEQRLDVLGAKAKEEHEEYLAVALVENKYGKKVF